MLRSLHITRFFFLIMGIGVLLLGTSYFLPWMMIFGKLVLIVGLTAMVLDVFLVFLTKQPLAVKREFQERMNLGDANTVLVTVINKTYSPLPIAIYEGFPLEMQRRNFSWWTVLAPKGIKTFSYEFVPKRRGEYAFRDIVVFMRSPLFLAQRRIVFPAEETMKVIPSVLQMRQYELKVFNQQTQAQGIKKVRRLGLTSEFEQIKNYVQGDDIRTINWKATSRKNELMVNQYQDEKSQPVYCVIDKSRPMQHAFDDMTMLDYAINSSLVFSNIALRKGDRAGLITFSDKIGTTLAADKSNGQLRRILDELYNQQTHFKEANFELLYQTVRMQVKTRSLLLLFTNFESEFAMRRALPLLQRMNKRHVLVVVFFQNNELDELAQQSVVTAKDLVQATIAEKVSSVKWSIARELRRNGIQTILTSPQELSINTINKYLELKAKGVI